MQSFERKFVFPLFNLFFIIFFSLNIIQLNGTNYYVAPNGNDNDPGTESQPWLTIQKAADTMVAGDTVFIKQGTYYEQVTPLNSGSAGNYITYTSYLGDSPTLDGTGVTLYSWSGLLEIYELEYLIISGLRITNVGPYDNDNGILVESSHHIILENNYTYNTTSSGIGVWDCTNITIDNNEIELACNDGEQECISIVGTDIFEVKNNHIHDGGPGTIGGEGIDAKDGSSNGSIHDNYVHDIPDRLGIYVDSWATHTYNIEVYNNIVHNY